MALSRIPPQCTIEYHDTLPITAARKLCDHTQEDGSFFVYFQTRRANGTRLREVEVYRYMPLALLPLPLPLPNREGN